MFFSAPWETAFVAPAMARPPQRQRVQSVRQRVTSILGAAALLMIGAALPPSQLLADDQLHTQAQPETSTATGTPEGATATQGGAAGDVATEPAATPALQFSFSGASWREVLNWLAEESQLALHVGDMPAGSFTYFDPETFSPDEAISRVNLFLIPQGYTVVRRGKLLSVIGLGDPRSLQQLDALAALTPLEQLEQRSEHEMVKCVIPLGDVRAEDAIAELRPLLLMIAPVVLPKSNQLIVTETAGKLQSVVSVVRAMAIPKTEAVVRRFDLEHVDAETVLLVASSHLGLSPGESAGLDVSISTDVSGKTLFVSGAEDKVSRLGTLLKVLDVADRTGDLQAAMKLRSHPVTGDNLQAVYDVLQTILAGKSLRLSMQPSTNSIVALADASVHQEIESTIAELQAPAIDFAVINLNQLDPYFVVTLIGEMFESPAPPTTRDSTSRTRTTEVVPSTAPKVDADPGNRRLFVRGTTEQIAQIKQMVESLDTRQASRDPVRVLPLRGQQRQQVLEAAERHWRGDNRVLILPSTESGEIDAIERAIHPDRSQDQPVSTPAATPPLPDDSFAANLTKTESNRAHLAQASAALREKLASSREAWVSHASDDEVSAQFTKAGRPARSPIRSQLIPQGIMIQSDDLAALDQFQDHLMEIAASSSRSPSPPVVYYLKYVSADDAVKMLADLLDGANALAETPAGSLINASSRSYRPGSYVGSYTTKRDGMTTVTAGTATIVSDARLNRLIIQGTTEDVAVIDGYLKIVDKGSSITNIETFGRTHIIELVHTKAADVAEVVKQAYAGRIANSTQTGQAGATPQTRPSSDSDSDRRRSESESRRDVAEKPTRGRQPEMTVAAHEPSNSLVITAPDALFAEVENLVRSVDVRSEQVIEVISASAGVDLESILMSLNGERSSRDRPSTSSSTTSRPSTSSSTSSRPSSSSSTSSTRSR
jgi:type II secretory pathway component GspD/PulD (secretin)